jgi:hypothetical protein
MELSLDSELLYEWNITADSTGLTNASIAPCRLVSFTVPLADHGAAFFLCVFATDLAPAAFARSRAALLAAARLSGVHGVY